MQSSGNSLTVAVQAVDINVLKCGRKTIISKLRSGYLKILIGRRKSGKGFLCIRVLHNTKANHPAQNLFGYRYPGCGPRKPRQ